jgi:hypothetical protein
MLISAVKDLLRGVSIDSVVLYAKDLLKRRFCEEVNLSVQLKKEEMEKQLMNMKAFYGREPEYKPWVELFDINNHITMANETIKFFDSVFEDTLISIFAQEITPGGKIFIEYYEDKETIEQLKAGFPIPVTRLGFKLLNHGFTWFKDWYFPEGFMEGGQKLQGEKPVNEESKNRQLKEIKKEIVSFLRKINDSNIVDIYIRRAKGRSEDILKII